MNKKISLTIVTPYGNYLKTTVDFIRLTTSLGVMGILPNHAPLITTVEVSELLLRNNSEDMVYAVGGGLLNIKENSEVHLLVNSIEASNEIDIERALEAKKRAEALIESTADENDVTKAKTALARALNRISIYNKK